jgi:hypothetical protein
MLLQPICAFWSEFIQALARHLDAPEVSVKNQGASSWSSARSSGFAFGEVTRLNIKRSARLHLVQECR